MTNTAEVDVEAARPPGRPRSPEADRAILTATIDLLADEGFGGVTMEGVAGRAGVGKATVYRRWASKSALVVDAMSACRELSTTPPPDTGSLRADLLAFVQAFRDHIRTSDAGRVMPAIVAELARNPELAVVFREEFVAPRRARVIEAVRRGAARGEVRADIDPDVVADGVVSLLMYRFLISGMDIDEGLPERVVDLLWRGITAP
jgi:AcrR family transcriptional regulator